MFHSFGNLCDNPWFCRGEWQCRFGYGCGGQQCASEYDVSICVAKDDEINACDESGDYSDDETAFALFMKLVTCQSARCGRSLTSCYSPASHTYMAQLFSAYKECQSCNDMASLAFTGCGDQCGADYDTCAIGCDTAPDYFMCIGDCTDILTGCSSTCDVNYYGWIPFCSVFVNPAIYLNSLTDCRIAESRRVKPDPDIDARFKGDCSSGEFECGKPCQTAYQSSLSDNWHTYAASTSGCGPPSSDGYSDCINGAVLEKQILDLHALQVFQVCATNCCLTWRKSKLDGDGQYDIQWLVCSQNYDSQYLLCNGDADCQAAAGVDRDACLAGITSTKPCLNCGSRIYVGDLPYPYHAPFDLSAFNARFTC